ncbi:MAG: serine hydrolase domain-containing protein [Pseudomonadota bacterium]
MLRSSQATPHHTAALALAVCTTICLPASAQQNNAKPEADWVIAFESGLRAGVRPAGEGAVRWTLEERMAHYKVPGVSIAVLRGGEVVWAKGYGQANVDSAAAVDQETVFSVGSLSKTGAAMAALKLADQGKVGLDQDVNKVLKQWRAPAGDNAAPLTLRMLLSHTAGLNNHGFADFGPEEALPDTVQILEGSGPAKNGRVKLSHEPGKTYDYSGGGTTVAGLVVEDVMGLPFPQAADVLVFEPLGMQRTTFEVPLPPTTTNIAFAHDEDGRLTALPRGYHSFPETAASGLWTTPTDYGAMLGALWSAYSGADTQYLSRDTAVAALTQVWPSTHALGPQIISGPTGKWMHHTGANEAYRATYDVDLGSGDGAVIFTNGSGGSVLFSEILRSLSDALNWGRSPEYIAIEPPATLLTELEGDYELSRSMDIYDTLPPADIPDEIEVSIEGKTLMATSGGILGIGEEERVLHAITPTSYLSGDAKEYIEFIIDTSGEVVGLSYKRGYSYVIENRRDFYSKD